MDLDRHADLDSPLHSWDPRWKVASLTLLVFVCAAASRPITLAAVAVVSVLLAVLSRIPGRFFLGALKPPFFFVLIMTPVLALTGGGTPLLSWYWLGLSGTGLQAAGQIAVKALSIMLIFLCVFGTARLNRTLRAMEMLKVPPAMLAVFLLTYRFIFLYRETVGKLFLAARLRGYTIQRGLKHIGTTAGVFTTLLIRSYEHSERVYAAMKLRGFSGSFPAATPLRWGRIDLVKALVVLGVCAGMIWMEVL